MCGISGIINKINQEVHHDEIQEMNDLISHRGPDGEGVFFNKNFAFGHRRLSVIDLSDSGLQPMHLDNKYSITYNGEIFNYLEIKEELTQCGYTFQSNTDTEVILASYDKWKQECVSKFNGMWSFALYDKEEDIIFCSRDRFGIKPFYYTEIQDKFVFGSEIKQLLGFHKNRYVNKKILMDYLVIGFEDHTNETFFENIFKLEQSHNLIYSLKSNTFQIKRYYNIENSKIELNELDSINNYKSKLSKSIALRLRSDVRIGTCLSGGLDSSSIAAIASSIYYLNKGENLLAIHAKSSDKISDESLFARLVSDSCQLDLETIEPTKEDFIQSINEVIETQEEPFGGPSVFMQYFVMKKANEIGYSVLLDGQGGDETLVGYERYYPAYLMSLGKMDFLKGFFNSSKNSKLTKLQLISYFIYFTNYRVRIRRLKKKNSFIKKKFLSYPSYNTLIQNAKSYLDLNLLQKEEIFHTQLPHLLRYADKNSMKHSIETRLPFIDYTVVETALSTHNKYKIKDGWTKYLLRKAMDNKLPDEIIWRKNKFGFEAPVKSWLESIDSDIAKSIMNSTILKNITDEIRYCDLDFTQKWRLFNIAKWEEIYNVSIKV